MQHAMWHVHIRPVISHTLRKRAKVAHTIAAPSLKPQAVLRAELLCGEFSEPGGPADGKSVTVGVDWCNLNLHERIGSIGSARGAGRLRSSGGRSAYGHVGGWRQMVGNSGITTTIWCPRGHGGTGTSAAPRACCIWPSLPDPMLLLKRGAPFCCAGPRVATACSG